MIRRENVQFGPVPVTALRREDLRALPQGALWSDDGCGYWRRHGDHVFGPFDTPEHAHAWAAAAETAVTAGHEMLTAADVQERIQGATVGVAGGSGRRLWVMGGGDPTLYRVEDIEDSENGTSYLLQDGRTIEVPRSGVVFVE